jgi:hypothetical protein
VKRKVARVRGPVHKLYVHIDKGIFDRARANAYGSGRTLRDYLEEALLEALFRDELTKRGKR